MRLTVACVLRSGGRYGVDDVRKLYGMVKRNLSHFDRFVCLSDLEFEIEGVERVPLIDRFPGWWSKVELWRASVFYDDDRVFYLDLDSVVTGNLDSLVARTEDFLAIKDFYRQPPRCAVRLGSGLMLWTPTYHGNIYTDFIVHSKQNMAACPMGDQEWIERYVPSPAYWQDVLPGKVLSFRVHLEHGKIQPPATASVIAFHGLYKPRDYGRLPWVKEHWAA